MGSVQGETLQEVQNTQSQLVLQLVLLAYVPEATGQEGDWERACQGERECSLKVAGEDSSWLLILPDSMIALVFSGLWPSHL